MVHRTHLPRVGLGRGQHGNSRGHFLAAAASRRRTLSSCARRNRPQGRVAAWRVETTTPYRLPKSPGARDEAAVPGRTPGRGPLAAGRARLLPAVGQTILAEFSCHK